MGKTFNFSPKNKSRDMSAIDDLKGVSNTPCTVAEATQIAFAAARDIVEAYTADLNKVVIQQTLMIESLRSILSKKGGFTDQEFKEEYTAQALKYNEEKKAYLESLIKKETSEDIRNEETDSTRPE